MDIFILVLKIILMFEGGWLEEEQTYKGVMQSTYNSYRIKKKIDTQDVRLITNKELHDLYFTRYFNASWTNEMDYNLALVHFDAAINFGVTRSMTFLWKALDTTKLKRTQLNDLLKKVNQDSVALKYIEIRKEFRYDIVKRKPEKKKFLKGWLRRDTRIIKYFAPAYIN